MAEPPDEEREENWLQQFAGERTSFPSRPDRYNDQPSLKRRDFVIGLVGWFVINSLIWFAIGVWDAQLENLLSRVIVMLSTPINIIALIILAFTRRWIALGALTAFAANLLIALVMGLILAVTCTIPFLVPLSLPDFMKLMF
ncbi:MAG: hypothetical protein HYR94_05205 [Chloroflexi bacterium]|nr:hypothetical protein [Chloroflexota bacterium]